jgi:hypothetical protein
MKIVCFVMLQYLSITLFSNTFQNYKFLVITIITTVGLIRVIMLANPYLSDQIVRYCVSKTVCTSSILMANICICPTVNILVGGLLCLTPVQTDETIGYVWKLYSDNHVMNVTFWRGIVVQFSHMNICLNI